jgi:hypothetical protein
MEASLEILPHPKNPIPAISIPPLHPLHQHITIELSLQVFYCFYQSLSGLSPAYSAIADSISLNSIASPTHYPYYV